MSANLHALFVRHSLRSVWLAIALCAVKTASGAPTVGPLNASPSSLTAGVSTSVTVTAPITAGTPLAGGVNLLQEDASGNMLSNLGSMHDDGLNGDAVAGDGTYTLVVPFNPDSQTAAIYLQATAAFKGLLSRVKSSVLTIQVTTQSAPTITVSPTSLTFPAQNVGSTSSAQTFNISNSGSQPIAISSITTSGDFAISANTCPASLTATTSCTISVTFTPTVLGARTSSVAIADNATGSPQSVSLSGTGQSTSTPTITINPTSLIFPAQNLNTTSAAKTFTVTNSGSLAVTISSVTTSADFAITANTCSASLAASTNCTVSVTFTPTTAGTRTSSVVIADNATGSPQSVSLSGTGQQPTGPFTITSFGPGSGSIGTLVKVVLNSFTPGQGTAPTVTMASLQSGSISAPVSAFSQNALSFVIPAGAGTGPFSIALGGQSATSATPFTVSTSTNFTLNVGPGTANLIQGQSVTYAVTVSSPNGFDGLATLSVSGVPSGVQSSFKPQAVTAGQMSILTLTAPSSQSKSTATLSFSASATIDGQSVSQTATAALNVTAITTTFLGRTVVDDTQETPIAGVTIKFLGVDAQGNPTGCSAQQTVSDAGGNFSLPNLPQSCTGPQLISYNGMTATAPTGKYAGVNLSYTLAANQVTASPVLVHLPRIDNGETVQVQQNSSTDQVFTFQTIPGLKVIVYAGTTFTLDDGSKPNPFPLVAVEIPLDRLPEQMATNGMVNPFIVAFQPANAMSSQPAAVNYPNPMGFAPATKATFMTLDPTRGFMVPYGTGTVSNDGTSFIADADPNHAGHQYGLIHFDWHGPAAPPPPDVNPSPDGCGGSGANSGSAVPDPSACQIAGPVDVASGILSYVSTDLAISNRRGSIGINRFYRTLSSNTGPFGLGTSHDYSYVLNTAAFYQGNPVITLVTPQGNQFSFVAYENGIFANSTIPALRNVSISTPSVAGPYVLRWNDGTSYFFETFNALGRPTEAFLTKIVDPSGNTTSLTLNPAQPVQILAITDSVGRVISLNYDNSNRIIAASDPIGRSVKYAYSGQDLAQFTDAIGGITSYSYDSNNNLLSITDPRKVVTEQNTYDSNGRVSSQNIANGGTYSFAYTLLSQPTALTQQGSLKQVSTSPDHSPIVSTIVTDPVGNATTYRFDTTGFLVSVIDASGQQRSLIRDPSHNNLVKSYQGAGTCPVCGKSNEGNVSFTFDQLGNVLTRTDGNGQTTSFTYDLTVNKVTTVTDPLGAVSQLRYDSSRRLIALVDPKRNSFTFTYDTFGEPASVKDPLGNILIFVWDTFGNLIQVKDPQNNITSVVYDSVSRPIERIDGLGRKRTATYDNLDRIKTQTDAIGHATSFSYDGIGNMLSITDSLNRSIALNYASSGLLLKRTDSFGRSEQFTYDKNDNLIKFIDRRGQNSTFAYDQMNRLVTASYQDGDNVTYGYDPAGRLLTANDSVGGLFSFVYDSAGRITAQLGPSGTILYSRDQVGRIVQRQVVGQDPVAYTYDDVGNVATASLKGTSVRSTYDAMNRTILANRSNGVTTSYSYDSLGRMTLITHTRAGVPLQTQQYTYDAVGDPIVRGDSSAQSFATQALTATVDAGNQLLSADGTSYTYDENGNRLTSTDSNGLVTSYTWDGRNRLSSISNGADREDFHYDYLRNLTRIDKIVQGSVSAQQYVFDTRTNIVATTALTGSQAPLLTGVSTNEYYALVNGDGTATFRLEDRIGSTIAVTDSSGNVASTMAYDPYGTVSGGQANAFPLSFAASPLIQPNLYYFRNRFYDSGVGRFLSEDPFELKGTETNLYLYAADNPTAYIDPLGLDPVIPDPNGIVPGGPWTPAPGQRPGTFFGPKQPSGPRSICRYVPDKLNGGPKTANEPYWKTQNPGQDGWDRFKMNGDPATPDDVHPPPGRWWVPLLELLEDLGATLIDPLIIVVPPDLLNPANPNIAQHGNRFLEGISASLGTSGLPKRSLVLREISK